MGTLRSDCLKAKMSLPTPTPVLTPATATGCQRWSSHLEKVKLPQFSGKLEKYAEFKSQFQELCGGERYPAIIEITQLKQKIPREAAAALAGLMVPTTAWRRLNELYGDRESAILTALRKLRGFKSTKN